ncbi:hypothetical protein CFRS1_v006796 [Colletotrichum fructicola]|nr:hypothetical protein CFRS1_v006796 [Colletotrichum fructicola]
MFSLAVIQRWLVTLLSGVDRLRGFVRLGFATTHSDFFCHPSTLTSTIRHKHKWYDNRILEANRGYTKEEHNKTRVEPGLSINFTSLNLSPVPDQAWP